MENTQGTGDTTSYGINFLLKTNFKRLLKCKIKTLKSSNKNLQQVKSQTQLKMNTPDPQGLLLLQSTLFVQFRKSCIIQFCISQHYQATFPVRIHYLSLLPASCLSEEHRCHLLHFVSDSWTQKKPFIITKHNLPVLISKHNDLSFTFYT